MYATVALISSILAACFIVKVTRNLSIMTNEFRLLMLTPISQTIYTAFRILQVQCQLKHIVSTVS